MHKQCPRQPEVEAVDRCSRGGSHYLMTASVRLSPSEFVDRFSRERTAIHELALRRTVGNQIFNRVSIPLGFMMTPGHQVLRAEETK